MRIFSGVLLVLVFPALAGEEDPGVSSKAAVTMQPQEDVLLFDVDPVSMRSYVPQEHEIAVNEAGSALLLVVVQQADSPSYDGVTVGPSGFVRIWIKVNGPAEQIAIPGADWTLPRLYWHSLFEGSSNAEARRRQTRAGMVTETISSVDLGLLEAGNRSSAVEEGDRGLVWRQVEPDSAIEPQKIGVDHVVYSKGADGKIVTHRVHALASAQRFRAAGIAEVDEGTRLATYLSRAGRFPIRVHQFSPIDIKAWLGVVADGPGRRDPGESGN